MVVLTLLAVSAFANSIAILAGSTLRDGLRLLTTRSWIGCTSPAQPWPISASPDQTGTPSFSGAMENDVLSFLTVAEGEGFSFTPAYYEQIEAMDTALKKIRGRQ